MAGLAGTDCNSGNVEFRDFPLSSQCFSNHFDEVLTSTQVIISWSFGEAWHFYYCACVCVCMFACMCHSAHVVVRRQLMDSGTQTPADRLDVEHLYPLSQPTG